MIDPKQGILGVARRTGLEPQLRTVQRALSSPEEKRNRQDDEHLRLLLAFGLSPSDCCIDIGANVGAILEHMVRYAPEGNHIAYEPLPELAADLARRFPQVDVRAAAVSAEPGQRTFTRVRSAHTRSGFDVRAGEQDLERFDVAVEALDASLPDGFVPAVIKIDVEGAERDVLAGGLQTIRRHRPTVAFEHGGTDEQASSDIYTMLVDDAGMRLSDLDGDGPLSRDAFLAKVRSGSHWNFVARP
ncbi:MAG: Methyltransferase FkbM [Conexibacter sp.]|nr:Methyltransferase FkbM [Conexibacter sp.]